MNELQGFVDRRHFPPQPYLIDVTGNPVPNPDYSVWIQYDQCVGAWLFATIYRETMTEFHDLLHSL